jgi:hypothetical protein
MAYFIPEHAVRSPFLYANLHTVLFFYYSLSCAHRRLPVSVIPLQSDKISSLRAELPAAAAAMKKKNSFHPCMY